MTKKCDDLSAIHEAWLHSEIRLSRFIAERQGWTALLQHVPDDGRQFKISASYYRELQSSDELYQKNNWLLDYMEKIILWKPRTVIEVGAGNCLFSIKIAPLVESVTAIDWALQPACSPPDNLVAVVADITSMDFPKADVTCSADFLEHIENESLEKVLQKISASAPHQLHVIACYDDKHSHLTVMPPAGWISLFKSVCADFSLTAVECRRDDPGQIVCVIER